jgi:hypothetical protein
MLETVRTRGLSAGTLFKLFFTGYFFSVGPIILFCGVLSIFGYGTISYDGETLTGLKGFLASLIMIPIFSFAFAIANWILIGFGVWMYTRFTYLKIKFRSLSSSHM